MEHIFYSPFDDQLATLQSVLSRLTHSDKHIVLIDDSWVKATDAISYDSPQIRKVPIIAVSVAPMIILSKDTAAFGLCLPSQGEAKNQEMNAQFKTLFAPVSYTHLTLPTKRIV